MYKNNIGVMKYEMDRLRYDKTNIEADLMDNLEKVKMHKQLPYLVANVVEVRFPPQYLIFLSFCLALLAHPPLPLFRWYCFTDP